MIPKLRIGTDVVLHITFTSGESHTFGEINKLELFVRKVSNKQHTHQPTKTATNICCNITEPIYNDIEINSLVTSSNGQQITVDALFPADAQCVSGVYCLVIKWSEKTKDLIAEDEIYNFTFDTEPSFELVDNSSEVDTPNGQIEVTYKYN